MPHGWIHADNVVQNKRGEERYQGKGSRAGDYSKRRREMVGEKGRGSSLTCGELERGKKGERKRERRKVGKYWRVKGGKK